MVQQQHCRQGHKVLMWFNTVYERCTFPKGNMLAMMSIHYKETSKSEFLFTELTSNPCSEPITCRFNKSAEHDWLILSTLFNKNDFNKQS